MSDILYLHNADIGLCTFSINGDLCYPLDPLLNSVSNMWNHCKHNTVYSAVNKQRRKPSTDIICKCLCSCTYVLACCTVNPNPNPNLLTF